MEKLKMFSYHLAVREEDVDGIANELDQLTGGSGIGVLNMGYDERDLTPEEEQEVLSLLPDVLDSDRDLEPWES